MYFNVRGGAGDITKANTSARLQDNLYLAVNSEWLEKAKIPSDRSRTSSFDGIDLNIEKNLMQDFADFAAGKKELPTVPNFFTRLLKTLTSEMRMVPHLFRQICTKF